jgi:hypothetical protein
MANPNTFVPHPNPNYGNGIFRRRIRLENTPGCVIAELEDCNHGFRSRVYHDGKTVTDIVAETPRIPLTTCPGAVEPIRALAGMAIGSDIETINRNGQPKANCTHLFDLTALAIRHAGRDEALRVYDVTVDDESDEDGGDSRVFRNGELIHHWHTRQWELLAPAAIAGNPLYRGFTLWASSAFSGEEQEAAFVLQKGYFVAQARRHDLSSIEGRPAIDNTIMHGACYSYSSPQIELAKSTAKSTRDFTDCPEQLLAFR